MRANFAIYPSVPGKHMHLEDRITNKIQISVETKVTKPAFFVFILQRVFIMHTITYQHKIPVQILKSQNKKRTVYKFEAGLNL